MIDRSARNSLCELIRGLASGLITNDEFEDNIPVSNDIAIVEVWSQGAWLLYDDLREYKLTGKDALTKEDKSMVARWILFLKSNNEYVWPNVEFKKRFLHAISFGKFGQSTLEAWKEVGDINYWPFISENQLNSAKKEVGYLGVQTHNK